MKKKSLAIGLTTALAAAVLSGCATDSATTVPDETSSSERIPIERRANVSKVTVNAQGVETASGDIQVTKTTPAPKATSEPQAAQSTLSDAVRNATIAAVHESRTQSAALSDVSQADAAPSSASDAIQAATLLAVRNAASDAAALAIASRTDTTPYAPAQPAATPYASDIAAVQAATIDAVRNAVENAASLTGSEQGTLNAEAVQSATIAAAHDVRTEAAALIGAGTTGTATRSPYVIAPSSSAAPAASGSAAPAPTTALTEEVEFGAAVITVPQNGADSLMSSVADTAAFVSGAAAGTAQSEASPIRYPLLRRGKTSEAVTTLQEKLKDLGYLKGTTGYFGTDTEQALEEFQQANHLIIDGIAGSKTWSTLLGTDAVGA